MDSMRSLDTSLPPTSRPKRAKAPDAHLSFRSAALSVTNLYKSALADIENARSEGYQEALQDLIDFLDRGDLGRCEGEGRTIREWVAERLDDAGPGPSASDSDDESAEALQKRGSSPVRARNGSPGAQRATTVHADHVLRSDSAPAAIPDSHAMAVDTESAPTAGPFTFRSPLAYPTTTMESNPPEYTVPRRRTGASFRRSSNRHPNQSAAAAQAIQLALGGGVGHKRKLGPFSEFFGFDPSNDRKDGHGGGKRGRAS